MIQIDGTSLPAPILALFDELIVTLNALLAYRTFPKGRAQYAEEQIQRVADVLGGTIAEYYVQRFSSELNGLRRRAMGSEHYPQHYYPRDLDTEAGREEFWRQAFALEARILEAHYDCYDSFPKRGRVMAEELVERLRVVALDPESFQASEVLDSAAKPAIARRPAP